MKATGLYLSFGTEVIYDNAEFQIGNLDKTGIVGVNGAGKTTLFKVLLREQELDGGSVSLGNAQVGYLPQEIDVLDAETMVFDYIFDGRPIRKLERELAEIYTKLERSAEEQDPLLTRMSKIQARLENLDYYHAETLLFDLADNMHIDENMLMSKVDELSGGQKSKAAFARLLFSNPEILLLDEPTNHLDVHTKDFVIDYLKNYKGAVMIISHDADFLNEVVNKILFINKVTHKFTVYDGNYAKFLKLHADEQERKELRIVQQEREIKKLTEQVQRARQASATNHNLKRLGQDREMKLQKKLSELEVREKNYKHIKMNLHPKRESGKVPVEVNRLSFRYPDKPLLYRNLSFRLQGNERFLIVGENGVGKSTLLKLMIGQLTPASGSVSFSMKTDIGYYAQELELLDESKTVLENADCSDYNDKQIRNILANFLFPGDAVFKRVVLLSPGEKARLSLCKLLLKRANLLILDEPTNHLDPDTQAIIGENFRDYTGTILVVSHNPAFVEQIGITRMLILPEGRIRNYSRELLNYYYAVNTKDEK